MFCVFYFYRLVFIFVRFSFRNFTLSVCVQGLLISCNQMSAEYLFMTDKLYDISYDTGDKVIQCGRHNDIFKLWLQWRAKGTEGFEHAMDNLMDLTQHQVQLIKSQPDKFHLIMEPELVNVSFWYIPKRLRGVPHTPEKETELGKVSASTLLFSIILFHTYVFVRCNIVSHSFYVQFHLSQNFKNILFISFCFYFQIAFRDNRIDLSNNQSTYDGSRHIDGWLPARRSSAKFLPINHIITSSH